MVGEIAYIDLEKWEIYAAGNLFIAATDYLVFVEQITKLLDDRYTLKSIKEMVR